MKSTSGGMQDRRLGKGRECSPTCAKWSETFISGPPHNIYPILRTRITNTSLLCRWHCEVAIKLTENSRVAAGVWKWFHCFLYCSWPPSTKLTKNPTFPCTRWEPLRIWELCSASIMECQLMDRNGHVLLDLLDWRQVLFNCVDWKICWHKKNHKESSNQSLPLRTRGFKMETH